MTADGRVNVVAPLIVIISFSLLLVPVTVVSVLIISVTVEAGEAFLFQQVNRLFGFLLHFSFEQTIRFHSFLVHGNYLKGTFSTDCYQIDVEAMKALSDTPSSADQDNARWNTSDAGSNWSSSEQQGMRSYHCHTCGAELVTDETTAASTCAYCGSPVVLSDHLSGAKRPNYVIPFKVDKKTAKETLKNFYKGKIPTRN